MDITPHVDALRQDLARAARAMGPETEQAAERLGVALESSVRLALMEALSQAAAEITSELHGTSVEVRLQGREPVFTVVGAGPEAVADTTPVDEPVGDEGMEVARVTLRLPESLKARAEELAGRHSQSLNTWLVQAVRAAATTGITINVNAAAGPGGSRRTRSTNKRVQGWVR